MSDTQSNTIRNLLIAALSQYDSTIDLNTGSRAYTEIVTPIYNALSPDMFDSDLDAYLLAVLKEEYPSLELQEGDLLLDLLVKPLRLLIEPLKTEIELLKKRQSVNYASQLTLEDAEDLAANFFVSRHSGSRARGTVRVMLSSPTFLSITDRVRFSTTDGLRFYPLRQEFINAETVALQQIGSLYYVDITVIAEQEGDEYNIPPGSISVVEGIPTFVSATNPFSLELGTYSESKQELLDRTKESLTERSLTSRKGITARVRDEFKNIRTVSITGYGDPEMERDVLTGEGDGSLIATGMSFIMGRYMFMITGYEDSNGGERLPSPGDKVKLNFWKFMYQTSSVETNYIDKVIYSSYGDAVDMPTVHILQLKNNIDRAPISGGVLPGIYLGVFTAILSNANITISGLPDGVQDPNAIIPQRIASNSVHIGGKYDVWVRPTTVDTGVSNIEIFKSAYIDENLSVFFDGESLSSHITGTYPNNRAGLEYYVQTSSHTMYLREPVIGSASGSTGFITRVDGVNLHLSARSGSFEVGETLTGIMSGNTATVQQIVYTEAKKANIGSVLTTTGGPSDSYFILGVFENYYILSEDVALEASAVPAYIHKKTGVNNLFDPVFKVFPEAADYSVKLHTYTGRSDVEVKVNLEQEGVLVGDTLEILSSEDTGRYTIQQMASGSAATTTVTLDTPLSRSNSNVKFRVIREETAIDAPLIRVLPNGITQTGGAGSGFSIPYKKPVGAYARGAFSGTLATYDGLNGLVLPNMTSDFKGAGALVGDLSIVADPVVLQEFNTSVDDCISEGCDPCDGIAVTCSMVINGTPSNYSNTKFYISGLINQNGRDYLSDIKTWLRALISAFFDGVNSQSPQIFNDLIAFVDQFDPIELGEPRAGELIVKQFEMCLPNELFDGCNNVYLALPEFLWDSEFASVSSFSQAISEFISGRLRAKPTSLKFAKSGDTLHLKDGANEGEYIIDKVVNIPWYHGDTIATESTIDENGSASVTKSIVDSKVYDLTLVVIRGAFPQEVLKGTSEYFSNGLPQVQSLLPAIPISTLNTIETIEVATGTRKNPFDVIQAAYSTLFKAMYSQGFDLPETFDLEPGPVLTKLTKSFFSPYRIGNRSPQQTTRILFQDPIDVTVYSPKKCSEISWRKEIKTPGFITSSPISLAGAVAVANTTVKVFVTLNPAQSAIEYSGVVSADAATAADADELVAYIQAALDPTNSMLKVSQTTTILIPTVRTVYRIEMLQGGQGSSLKADITTGLSNLGFIFVDERAVGTGSSTRSSDYTVVNTRSNNGTKFSITQGLAEKRLIVDIQDTEDYYASIIPRRTASLELLDSDLPRDGIFSAHYLFAESCTMYFTDSDLESPIEAGVLAGDILYVHEQVCVLDNTGIYNNPFSTKKDRVLHVRYTNTDKSISLLTTAGTFLTPESTNSAGESPQEDVVEVGDIVYFEDVDESARVVRVSENVAYLDTNIAVSTQQSVLSHGKGGSVSGDQMTLTYTTPSPSDIGNYIVIYGSENAGVDGTYVINNIVGGTITLSESIAQAESDLHWAIVKPTFDEVGSSSIDGFSATTGLTPIRIYRGKAKEFIIGEFSSFLARERSSIELLYGEVDGGPRRGFKQPFRIARPSEYRITANQMAQQGTESGLYYMDVPTTTLTPDYDLNIPENTQYTPIVSTMRTKGYILNSKSRPTVFSTREQCELIIDSSYLPKELTGAVSNTQSPEKGTISISYETSQEASRLQAFLDSDENRNLCADPLVKHYLPGYILLEVTGGSENDAAQSAVIEYINGLSETDSLRLSDIEKRLHQLNIDLYNHPIFINCLTHDLNRDIILTRVDNYLDDRTILHDGTNRITYFIASEQYIKVGSTI